MSGNIRWTEEDEQFIRDNYKNNKKEVFERFSNRTRDAVVSKASKLGCSTPANRVWTPRELSILHKYWKKNPEKVMTMLKHSKSKTEVKNKAKELGIRNKYNTHWTPEEIEILHKYWSEDTEKVYELLSDRTVIAIIGKAERLGLSCGRKRTANKDRWTKEEVKLLSKYWKTDKDKLKSLLRDRSWPAIKVKASLIGLNN